MKNFKDIILIAALLITGTTSCKKESGEGSDGDDQQFTPTAQFFFEDNSSIVQEGDAVTSSFADGKLTVTFDQGDNKVAIEIPNYSMAEGQGEYTNGTATVSVIKSGLNYNSAFIFIPVILVYPPVPVFVQNKTITIKTNNTKVDENTTDISIQVTNGSELITVPVPGGNAPVYQNIVFVQGAGGKPNMVTVRIKQ